MGVECIGSADPDVDVEIIALGHTYLSALGLRQWQLVLNFMGTPADRLAYGVVLQAWLRERTDALAPAADRLRVAFVFGSVAQGRETAGSDIDVMLIGTLKFKDAVALLHPTQAMLGREVNPKVFTSSEFAAKANKEPFLADVLAKPKLFLIGNAHDLAELARHQP